MEEESEIERLLEWIDWFQDKAVIDFDDKIVGLCRIIKEEGLTVREFMGGKHD